MTRKTAAFLLALCLFVACSGVSFAAFDYSVFEQNEVFKVEMVEDGTMGRISFSSADEWPTDQEKAEVLMNVIIDNTTYGMPSLIQFVIPTANETKEGLGTRITLLPDMTGYTFTVWMHYIGVHFLISPTLFPMIEEIIDKNISSVKYKLSGDSSGEGIANMNVGNLKLLYELYKTAGGMEQDFTNVEIQWPVTVE